MCQQCSFDLLTHMQEVTDSSVFINYLFFGRNIELALHSFGYGLYITVDNKRRNKEINLFTDYFGNIDVSLFR